MTKLRRSGSMDFGNPNMSNVLDMAKALCLACKQRSKPKRSFSLFQIKVSFDKQAPSPTSSSFHGSRHLAHRSTIP
ncbi:hypothetical protein CEXT_241291 [Caerostris extrusa]|uniref:Uncharacterized protein n=1 Tax=Caerostris extrusa TaxID=172846 RepID=A0AAV4NDT2_CAEEX|nr:hypothetical protein CEXT_241291 [Caerostris extrusa]